MVNRYIIAQIIKGDERGLAHVYQLYSLPLLRFINSYLADYSLSKDVLQEVFIALWINRASIAEDSAIDKLLFTIAKNKSLNAIRSNNNRNKHIVVENSLSELKVEALKNHHEMGLSEQNMTDEISDLYNSLPKNYKEVFCMNKIEGYTYNEIAETLSISPKTVEKRMSAALKIMREKFKKRAFLFILVGIIVL